MPTLASELRNKLERVIIEAREAAEAGARAALEAVAAHHREPYPHMNSAQRSLRNHLRARARQLGDRQDSTGRLVIDHLVGECAYEHWHRMLFARFLAENGLLIEPQENMAISLAEAEELAKEDGVDVWDFASRCSQRMLPNIFRPDDPLLQVCFATEHMLKLEKLLASLPQAVFTASDALGWVYQFWQSKKKDEINRSEVKIGANEISAVTQLFTEPYMVEFLLHNTLGAWWAGKRLSMKDTANAKDEDELRRKLALPGVKWEFLRLVRDADGKNGTWLPAAGTFDGWPKTAAELRVLDPCCGSGHFLVAALHHLVPIRMAEEGRSTSEAIDLVLRDNLFGLEIDERCCQIAAFALAFAAWTYSDAGGYRILPDLHIACTGIGPQATEEQWIVLAEQSGNRMAKDEQTRIRNGLLNLHRLFSQAPMLGSLIDPSTLSEDVFAADYETIKPYLLAILSANKADDETRERAIAASGMVAAAELLAAKYALVITNVPYLGRLKQDVFLKSHLEEYFSDGKADLATAFLIRCTDFCDVGGTTGIVTPQNWLLIGTYERLRRKLLQTMTFSSVNFLGPGAFETIGGEVVNVALVCLVKTLPSKNSPYFGIDAIKEPTPNKKATALLFGNIAKQNQLAQLNNPDARIALVALQVESLLNEVADSLQGISTGDNPRLNRTFWEQPRLLDGWSLLQASTAEAMHYGGREHVVWLAALEDNLALLGGALRGKQAWGHNGISVNRMTNLAATLMTGEIFDINVATLLPKKPEHLAAIYAYCRSPEFNTSVRHLDKKAGVTNATLGKVHFDLVHWQSVGAEQYPDGLPEPESEDPTQWLFHGRPDEAKEETELQVAVARLLGYRWPAELDDKMQLSKRARALVKQCDKLARFADDDGIVCIPSARGEEPAAERLLALLVTCNIEIDADLDDWLRNAFFEEHCRLFQDRPFVWHIWDGRKRDGFHALINYHKLCEGGGKGRKLLESLTYSYLGEWITRQKDGVQRGEGGAEDRLAAALELKKRLEAILEGEPPFDLFVRWKPLAEQPIGWEPDINDGVRLNIRPFLARDLRAGRTGAGVLRFKPNIKWTKDRGKEPQRPKAEYPWFWNWDEKTVDFMGTGKESDGNRHNDCHYTNKVKQVARDAAKGTKRG